MRENQGTGKREGQEPEARSEKREQLSALSFQLAHARFSAQFTLSEMTKILRLRLRMTADGLRMTAGKRFSRLCRDSHTALAAYCLLPSAYSPRRAATLRYSDEQRHFLAAGIQFGVCGFGRIAARQDRYRQTPQQQQSGMAASPIEPADPVLRPDSLSARLSFAHRILDASHPFYRLFLGGNER